jgi:hypothetical protein
MFCVILPPPGASASPDGDTCVGLVRREAEIEERDGKRGKEVGEGKKLERDRNERERSGRGKEVERERSGRGKEVGKKWERERSGRG